MNKLFGYLFTVSLVVLVATACKPNKSNIEGFLSCEANCWFLIEPGKTNKSEVNQLLLDSPLIQSNSIMNYSYHKPNDSLKWEGKKSSLYTTGIVYFNDDEIVELIEIGTKRENLKLENVIEKYGQPDQVLVLSSWSEIRIISVIIIYHQQGFVFLSYFKGELNRSFNELEINGDLEINGLWYCEPSEVDKFLVEGPINRMDKSKLLPLIQKWEGENIYKIYDY